MGKFDYKSLMIGDWVMCPSIKEKYAKITEIYLTPEQEPKRMVALNVQGRRYCVPQENIEPVPLTTEILEKNGFLKEEKEGDPTFPFLSFVLSWIDEEKYHIEICWIDSHDKYDANTGTYLHGVTEEWILEIECVKGYISISQPKLYVHELQHAFQLCSIEKEIML